MAPVQTSTVVVANKPAPPAVAPPPTGAKGAEDGDDVDVIDVETHDDAPAPPPPPPADVKPVVASQPLQVHITPSTELSAHALLSLTRNARRQGPHIVLGTGGAIRGQPVYARRVVTSVSCDPSPSQPPARIAHAFNIDSRKRSAPTSADSQGSLDEYRDLKDKSRRLSHNEIEKRRRDKITETIMQLAEYLPPDESGQPAGATYNRSKGHILERVRELLVGTLHDNRLLQQQLAQMSTTTQDAERIRDEHRQLCTILDNQSLQCFKCGSRMTLQMPARHGDTGDNSTGAASASTSSTASSLSPPAAAADDKDGAKTTSGATA